MAKTRIHALVLVVMLVSLVPTRAFAESTDEIRAKKVAAAAKLDAAKADDDKLEAAVRTLDAGIAVQSNETDAAKSAAKAADSAVDGAQAKLQATETRMADLKTKASAVAVQAYIHPGADTFMDLIKSKDLAEASRRQALMSQVVQVDRDVLGQLRAVREDQQAQQANLILLRDQAQSRKKEAQAKLDELTTLRANQMRLKGALDVRIQEYQSEVNALSREEDNIQALIRGRQLNGESVDGTPQPAKSASGLIWPASGPVSSPFGYRWGALHAGIDIDAGYGARIVAAKAGTVISSGWNSGGYGNMVIIDHGGGFTTVYAHQSKIVVSEGQSVSQGQLVGYVGATGNVTGPHLHFETRVNGTPKNPMNYLP